jgi:hypothetical protein
MPDEPLHDYLVISRGKWDKDADPDAIQAAIDRFYVWLEENIAAGRMAIGSRLAAEGKTVFRNGVVTDGPFGETKELIGGFWFIRAASLDEAARLAGENPCAEFGLFYEIRPLEAARGDVSRRMTETPE